MAKTLLTAFAIFFAFSFDSTFCFEIPNKEQYRELTDRISRIIVEVYTEKDSTVKIISATEEPNDLKNEIIRQVTGNKEISVLLESPGTKKYPSRSFCNIFLIDSMQSFLRIHEKMSPTQFDFHGFFTIILTKQFDSNDQIFELMWSKQIYNVVILFIDDNGEIKVLAFDSFESKNCDEKKSVDISNLSNFFPDKLKNLNGCTLKVQASGVKPFVYLVDGKPAGRDFDLTKAIADELNMKLNFTVFLEWGSWGMIYENGTTTAIIKNLLESRTDIIIGDYYLRPSKLKLLDASDEYSRAEVVFVIPPGRNLMSIEKLLQPFDKTVWMSLTILISVIIVFVNILAPPWVDNHKITFETFSILFAVSLPRLPTRSYIRILMMSFVIFSLVNQAAYQSSLFKFLQTDSKVKEVQSIDEMVEKDFHFYVYETSFDYVKYDPRFENR